MRAIYAKKWFAVALFVHGHAMLHGQLGYEFGYRNMNAGEVAAAEALIAGHYDRPSTWLSNLLCFHYARCRPPMTGGGDEGPKSLPRNTVTERLPPIQPLLHIHPNPANTWVAFDYDLLVPPKDASIVVRDLMGRTVYKQDLREQQHQLVWDTRQTAPGTYAATLYSGGRALRTEKLILQP